MIRFVATLAVLAALLTACQSDGGTEPATSDAAPSCEPPLGKALDAWADAGFSGSVAMSTGGRFDCLAAYGPADRATGRPNTTDTVFSIGSVSKAVTATAVVHLVDDGRLALDDRAGDILPDLTGPAADATVRQLLLHTSGLTGSHAADREPLDRDAAVAAIGALEQAFEPGSEFLYSNAGYTLLALVVEAASGVDYRDYLASEVLPLPVGTTAGGFWDGEPAAPGPRAVGYLDGGPTDQMGEFPGPHWAMSGNGDLAMTMRDLASWTYALFDGQIVSPASTRIIARPGFDLGDGTAEAPGWIAYDASVFGEPARTAAGGGGDIGHEVVVAWLPRSDRVVAIASNTADVPAGDLLRAIGPALVASAPVPTPDPMTDVAPDAAADLVGVYRLSTGGSIDVAARGGRLALAARGPDAIAALFPETPGFTPADVRAHERGVMALLDGRSPEGRRERALIESELGPIGRVHPLGTIVDDGELRTYVRVGSETASMRLWYALDGAGGVAAAVAPASPPTLLAVPSAEGGFRPYDPTGIGPELDIVFRSGGVTLDGPGRPVTAERSG